MLIVRNYSVPLTAALKSPVFQRHVLRSGAHLGPAKIRSGAHLGPAKIRSGARMFLVIQDF